MRVLTKVEGEERIHVRHDLRFAAFGNTHLGEEVVGFLSNHCMLPFLIIRDGKLTGRPWSIYLGKYEKADARGDAFVRIDGPEKGPDMAFESSGRALDAVLQLVPADWYDAPLNHYYVQNVDDDPVAFSRDGKVWQSECESTDISWLSNCAIVLIKGPHDFEVVEHPEIKKAEA